MKKYSLLIALTGLCTAVFGQNVITMQSVHLTAESQLVSTNAIVKPALATTRVNTGLLELHSYNTKFDLSSIPVNAVVTAAHLIVLPIETSAHKSIDAASIEIARETNEWNALDNALPLSSEFDTLKSAFNGQQMHNPIVFDVSGIVQYWIVNPTANFGWEYKINADLASLDLTTSLPEQLKGQLKVELEVSYEIPVEHEMDKKISAEDLQVFPNPSTGTLNITTKHTLQQIEVINNAGQLVFQTMGNLSNQLQLNLEALTPGFYCVRIVTDDNKWMVRTICKQ